MGGFVKHTPGGPCGIHLAVGVEQIQWLELSSNTIYYNNTLRITQYEQHFLRYISKKSVHYTIIAFGLCHLNYCSVEMHQINVSDWLLSYLSMFLKCNGSSDRSFILHRDIHQNERDYRGEKVVQGLLSKLLIGWRQIWKHVKKGAGFNWTKWHWHCD